MLEAQIQIHGATAAQREGLQQWTAFAEIFQRDLKKITHQKQVLLMRSFDQAHNTCTYKYLTYQSGIVSTTLAYTNIVVCRYLTDFTAAAEIKMTYAWQQRAQPSAQIIANRGTARQIQSVQTRQKRQLLQALKRQ